MLVLLASTSIRRCRRELGEILPVTRFGDVAGGRFDPAPVQDCDIPDPAAFLQTAIGGRFAQSRPDKLTRLDRRQRLAAAGQASSS
jgi:hypothetical protein